MKKYDVVDLGTKNGDALTEFYRRAGATVLTKEELRELSPDNSIGYEREAGLKYEKSVTSKGYKFGILDLNKVFESADLPMSRVFLAWHILEHLQGKPASAAVVRWSYANADLLCWYRLPSFQPDKVTGEGVLREKGLRFTWTHWKGHPTAWLVQDTVQVLKEEGVLESQILVRPADYIKSVEDKRVVPIDAPVDTTAYNPEMGIKPKIHLKQPIVAAWDIIVRK